MFDIEEELKKLPRSPGVYIIYDKRDETIYVGKTILLRNRMRQYFQSSRGKSPKIMQMISRIARFEYIVTDSGLGALVLENNLIKENHPRYNAILRDDKTYPYIKVTVREPFPRIFMIQQMKKDKAKYFGPFSSSQVVRKTLDFIYRALQFRDCKHVLPRGIGKEKPCLNYHIHQCGTSCTGYMGEKIYRANVGAALDFLNGKFEPTVRKLKDEMEDAATRMELEHAGELRDLLCSTEHIK